MPKEREYISWEDVAQLVLDVEGEYPCLVHIAGTARQSPLGPVLHWTVEALTAAGDPWEPRCWRGGSQKQYRAKTAPGLLVALLTALAGDVEIRLQQVEQTPLEREIGA